MGSPPATWFDGVFSHHILLILVGLPEKSVL